MNQIRNLKKDLVKIISLNMGERVAHRFDSFYHAENPQVLLSSADNLLTEFLGKRKAGLYLDPLYSQFSIKRF